MLMLCAFTHVLQTVENNLLLPDFAMISITNCHFVSGWATNTVDGAKARLAPIKLSLINLGVSPQKKSFFNK